MISPVNLEICVLRSKTIEESYTLLVDCCKDVEKIMATIEML